MSVPVTVQIPVVTTMNDTAAQRGRVVAGSFDLACEFEELADKDAPVVLVTPPHGQRYRRNVDGGWLKELGPRPDDHRRYRWLPPTAMELPGEFWLDELRGLVPPDRRQHLAKALERAFFEPPEQLTKRLRQPTVRARVEAQIEARADYGDQFKIIGSELYRLCAEPYLGLRSDGFVIGNHSTKGWQTEAHRPSDLYSFA